MKYVLIACWFLSWSGLRGFGQIIDLTQDQMRPDEYNPAKILKVANRLISEGEANSYASMLAYRPETQYSFDEKRSRYYEYVTWLCVLLYEPKPGSTLETPLFGSPTFPFFGNHHQDNAAWPKFPLAFARGVPFYVALGYSLAGYTYPSAYYVKLYHEQGIFRTQPYPIPARNEAEKGLNELLNSPQWKALDWNTAPMPVQDKTMVIEALRQQVKRISWW